MIGGGGRRFVLEKSYASYKNVLDLIQKNLTKGGEKWAVSKNRKNPLTWSPTENPLIDLDPKINLSPVSRVSSSDFY